MRAPSFVLVLINVGVILIGTLVTFVFSDQPIGLAVGTSVLATGVCGIAMYFYSKYIDRFENWRRRLEAAGIADAYEARGTTIKEVYDGMLNARPKCVDILGMGLRSFREDYPKIFADWASAGTRVRILLLDPDHPTKQYSYAQQRDREEGGSSDIRDDVRAFLKAVEPHRSEKFQVRLSTSIPTTNIFRVDDAMLWGPYLIAAASRNSPTFKVTSNGFMFRQLAAHFETAWTDHSSPPSV